MEVTLWADLTVYLINHVSAETMTSGRMMISGDL